VVSRSDALAERFGSDTVLSPQEGETLLKDLSVVFITGHTADSAALYDGKTKMLICGDCLQLYGIFGSGAWGANISFSAEYAASIRKLRTMDVEAILTAHDYHPYGRMYFGKSKVADALDACLEPFKIIEKIIAGDPTAGDEAICEIYNSQNDLPTLGAHVVRKYRESMEKISKNGGIHYEA
jgi:glyoxylase-like metal-dependent hydrolase (beta-lactamase superfamily II)